MVKDTILNAALPPYSRPSLFPLWNDDSWVKTIACCWKFVELHLEEFCK